MDFDLRKRLLLQKPEPEGFSNILWVHCSSVGEFNTVKPLLKPLRERFSVLLTYFSPRSKAYLEKRRDHFDLLFPLPIDLPWIVRKFEETVKPSALIILERELWPSLLTFTRVKKVLINAYARGGLLEKLLVKKYSLIIARKEEDKEEFIRRGARKVTVCGNLKLAGFPEKELKKPVKAHGEKLFVAGSTHRGEEEIVLGALAGLIKTGDLKLVLAPRHISRAEEVLEVAQRHGLKASRWSKAEPEWEVLVVDTLGDLMSFYSVCDIAFVGGTLVPVGGHNLLEPAFFDKPVLFGPHTEKVTDLEELLIHSGLGFMVSGEREILDTVNKVTAGFNPGKKSLREIGMSVKDCYLKNILSELEK